MHDWVTVAIQASGAIAVCAMFLKYLQVKQKADDEARIQFLTHLKEKDAAASADIDKQVEYLKSRDTQSKEIAQSGHAALNEVAVQLSAIKERITAPNTPPPNTV